MNQSKDELRRQVLEMRSSLSPESLKSRSEAIGRRVQALPAYRKARTVMIYVAFNHEVETRRLILAALAGGKRVAVPLCRKEGRKLIPSWIHSLEELAPGTLGILEPRADLLRPLNPEEIDLVLMPGVAFDRQGNRLGYGAGYYDRFLPLLGPGAVTAALALDLQIAGQIQTESHDRPVDLVITESAVYLAGGEEKGMEVMVGNTLLKLLQGDITQQETAALVNAANSGLLGGGGVDGAIHRAGGPRIMEECRQIRERQGGCPTGEAVLTGGGRLKARYVIHAVGPVWEGGGRGEDDLLRRAYRSSLDLASTNGIRSLSFPSISTGAYGFPVARAARLALAEVRGFLQEHSFEEVRFVLFSERDLHAYEAAWVEINGN